MSNPIDSKHGGTPDVEAAADSPQVEHVYDLDEKADIAKYKDDAIVAENQEHDMGVLAAVRAYPAATFWAFIMSSTIVSTQQVSVVKDSQLTLYVPPRSWSPTVSS